MNEIFSKGRPAAIKTRGLTTFFALNFRGDQKPSWRKRLSVPYLSADWYRRRIRLVLGRAIQPEAAFRGRSPEVCTPHLHARYAMPLRFFNMRRAFRHPTVILTAGLPWSDPKC